MFSLPGKLRIPNPSANLGGEKEEVCFMKHFHKAMGALLSIALAWGVLLLPHSLAEAKGADLLKVGRKNNPARVREVQTRLQQTGLYQKQVTGVYDGYTRQVVLKFQKLHHLYWIDGIVGPETLGTLQKVTKASKKKPVTSHKPKVKVQKGDIDLLARAVYSEARGEPFKGQVAVAAVVLNRVGHNGFPKTIRGVIYQPGAFTSIQDGQFWLTPDQTAYKAAREALSGVDPTYGAIYYYNPSTASSWWMRERAQKMKTEQIGHHIFMR
jgi:N-acetylmuramoyl-L-alanine amidase